MSRSHMVIARSFVCAEDDLEDGESMTVSTGTLTGIDEPVAVYRVNGEFFATSDTCTHEKWSLGEEGDLEGHEIVCTLHNARFDVRSGEPLCFPAVLRLKSYSTSVEDGKIYVTAGERGESEH